MDLLKNVTPCTTILQEIKILWHGSKGDVDYELANLLTIVFQIVGALVTVDAN